MVSFALNTATAHHPYTALNCTSKSRRHLPDIRRGCHLMSGQDCTASHQLLILRPLQYYLFTDILWLSLLEVLITCFQFPIG